MFKGNTFTVPEIDNTSQCGLDIRFEFKRDVNIQVKYKLRLSVLLF